MYSRRVFLQGAASLAALSGPARSGEPRPRERLQEFDYSDVILTGGPLKAQYDRTHAHFLTLDNDRLLKVYRQRAGLPAPGEDMGGWYDADGFVPGHTIGQYISGLSRFYSNTGDTMTRAKVRALVQGFAATLGPRDYPYASEKGAITWPCYILDKYEAGMLDAARLAGVESARDVLPRVIRGAFPYIPDHTYDRTPDSPKQAPYDEPYIMPENLFNAWEFTGEKQFLEMAKLYLLNREFFDPLAKGDNILPGKHGYSHLIALSSGAKAYQVLGERRHLDALRNAWDLLEQTQQYASGGSAPKEAYVEPHRGKLAESLSSTREHFETPCGAYAHLKLARYLLRFTGEGRYGDGLERVLYNTILGALDPGADGEYFYYSDYQAGARKGYYKKKWPCCSGTLAQTVADYVLNVYFRDAGGIWVNLYTPSEVRWKNVRLIQSTDYPRGDTAQFRVDVAAPSEFTLNLRIPGWLAGPAAISVNGKSLDAPADRPAFAAVRRRWRKNDVVEVKLPFAPRTEAIDDRNPNTVAVMNGPLMLVAVNPPADAGVRPLALPDALKPLGAGTSRFLTGPPERPLVFAPFCDVREDVYTTYFRKG